MSVVKRDPRCGWCVYHESDGHCTCKYRCDDCGTEFIGFAGHSKDDCIKALKQQLVQTQKIGE